jgi:general secretion pathway protein I
MKRVALHSRAIRKRCRPIAGRRRARAERAGLSLFEVVIALAVFLVSIAAIGQLISSGVRGALQARLQTQAVLRCESKLSEVVAGITDLQNAREVPYTDDAAWNWSVNLTPGPQEDLYLVEVTVAHSSGSSLGRISFSLTRLIRDPEAALEAQAAQQQQQQSSGSSSSSSTTGSSGGSR